MLSYYKCLKACRYSGTGHAWTKVPRIQAITPSPISVQVLVGSEEDLVPSSVVQLLLISGRPWLLHGTTSGDFYTALHQVTPRISIVSESRLTWPFVPSQHSEQNTEPFVYKMIFLQQRHYGHNKATTILEMTNKNTSDMQLVHTVDVYLCQRLLTSVLFACITRCVLIYVRTVCAHVAPAQPC